MSEKALRKVVDAVHLLGEGATELAKEAADEAAAMLVKERHMTKQEAQAFAEKLLKMGKQFKGKAVKASGLATKQEMSKLDLRLKKIEKKLKIK